MTATLCNHTCDAYPRLFQFIRVHCKFSLFSFSFCTEGINQNNTYSITCILIAFLLPVFRYAIQYNSFALNSKCLTPLDVFDAPLDFWVTEFDKQRHQLLALARVRARDVDEDQSIRTTWPNFRASASSALGNAALHLVQVHVIVLISFLKFGPSTDVKPQIYGFSDPSTGYVHRLIIATTQPLTKFDAQNLLIDVSARRYGWSWKANVNSLALFSDSTTMSVSRSLLPERLYTLTVHINTRCCARRCYRIVRKSRSKAHPPLTLEAAR